jgi:hypothetical protein
MEFNRVQSSKLIIPLARAQRIEKITIAVMMMMMMMMIIIIY